MTTFYVIQPRLSDAQIEEINNGGGWSHPIGKTYLALTCAPEAEGIEATLRAALDADLMRMGWLIEADELAAVFAIGNGMGATEGHRWPTAHSVSVGDVVLHRDDETGNWVGNVVASVGFLPVDAQTALALSMRIRWDDMTDEELANVVFARGFLLTETYDRAGRVWCAKVLDGAHPMATTHGLANERPAMRRRVMRNAAACAPRRVASHA